MLLLRIIKIILRKKGPLKTRSEIALYSSSYYANRVIHESPHRYYSDKLCPPGTKKEIPKKSNKGLWTAGLLAFVGGATLGYAKYDPDFRSSLNTYIPFTDDALKTLFREDKESLYESIKKSILNIMNSNDAKSTSLPPPKEYKAPPPVVPLLEKDVKKSTESYSEIRVDKKEKCDPPKSETAEAPKKESSGSSIKELAELEEKLSVSAAEAVNGYKKAIHIIQSYNSDVEFILDEAVNEVKPEVWDRIRSKTRAKEECIKRAQESVKDAERDIAKLKQAISAKDFNASDSTKQLIKNNIAKVQDDIYKAKKDYETQLKKSSVTVKYWDRVEKARQHFSEELESLFPTIDLSKKELSVSEQDLDLFILHAYAHVLFYQKELAKMETMMQSKIQSAVDAARRGGVEPLTVVQICEAVEQEKRKLTLCFQQQALKIRKECEDELREQLKRQSQAFSDHLGEAIKMREVEIERLLTRKFDEALEEERCKYKLQLAAIIGRLQGLDDAIKAKVDADEKSKQAQILWSACQALLRAVRAGCPGLSWKEQIRSLEPEVATVRKAAATNDELVEVVLAGIPKEALERGVYPEDALRERFLRVESVARTVALVPEGGAALPVYILSYIQSCLLLKAASPIPQSELNNEQIDFSKLNTNDILQRARYWLDRGDFAQALKYMNLLKGAPRCVARQWMNEARILLETQQAAHTLMAHAASSGLVYL